MKIQILTSNMEECTESIKAATDCFKTMNVAVFKTKQLCTEVQCLESE